MRRSDSRWRTRFGGFVHEYGVPNLARDLQLAGAPVSGSAVYKWIRGATSPRPEVAQRMVVLSGGRLALDEVFAHRAEVTAGGVRGAGESSGGRSRSR